MESFKDDFKKSGGVKKIADFAREGVLGTVCGEILLLGRSHKALEIANLSAQFKIYNKLEKRYKKCLYWTMMMCEQSPEAGNGFRGLFVFGIAEHHCIRL